MQKTRKRLMSLLLSVVLVLSMVACGSSGVTATELTADVIQADVEEYIVTLVDASATITSFTQTQNSVSATEMEVVCLAAYAGDSANGTGTFTLMYTLENDTWSLEDLNADLADDASVSNTSSNSAEVPETAPEAALETAPETAPEAAPETAPETAPEAAPETASETAPEVASASTATSGDTKILSGYSLTEMGSFADGNKGWYVNYGMMHYSSGDGKKCVGGNGVEFADTYYDIDNIMDGYFAVMNSDTEINSTGLITIDGEQLIPCEAAYIEALTYGEYSRYVRVIYSTGETTSEDDAFFYVTNSMSLLNNGPEDGDVLHSGYAKIYDVEAKAFVPNLTCSTHDVEACGNSFFYTDEEGIHYLYNSAGEIVYQTANYVYCGNGYFLVSDSGYDVYNDQGEYLFSSGDSLSTLNSTSGYLKKYQNGNYKLINLQGEDVLPDVYKSITSECDGIIQVQAITGEYQLVNLNGEVLASTYDYFSEIENGYYYCKADDGTYSLVGPDGILAENLSDAPYKLVAENGETVFVVDTKSFSLEVENTPLPIAVGLISAKSDSTGKYGVFDLFSGKQILDYQYSDIECDGSYIYARQGDTWTSFKLNPIYR